MSSDSVARKRSNQFMIRVAEGMAGWSSFTQATRGSPVYSEYLTYLPIFQICSGRGWKAKPQKKLKRANRQLGRSKTVDFAIQSDDKRIGIFVEVKFVKSGVNHCLQITKDALKLSSLGELDISSKSDSTPKYVFRYVMIVGRLQELENRVSAKAKKSSKLSISKLGTNEDKRLLTQLSGALKNVSRNPKADDGWMVGGLGAASWRHAVLLLCEQDWWKKLQRLKADSYVDDSDSEFAEGDDLALVDTKNVEDDEE